MFNRKEYDKKYREDNPVKNREKQKRYYDKNREKIRERKKRWERNNSEHLKNKYKTNLKFNLNCRIVRAVSKSLKGNKAGRHWEDLVGYNLKDLIKRLKQTMPGGYTWQDYLEGKLHVDHIIPKSVFNFTESEHIDFKRCWALKNLRLLPARKNISKGNKLDKPFQPTLKIFLSF